MNKLEKVIVVLSGGMDSVTVLYDAVARGYEVEALSFDYGSKHNIKEAACSMWHCKHLDIPQKLISLDLDKHFSSSLLVGGGDIPEGHYADDNMKSTVVPFRNGIMLSFAIGYAESIGASKVLIGSHKGDHTVYLDCREEFTQAMNLVAMLGTYEQIRVESPFNKLMKWNIVERGMELNIDYSKTWSCYKGLEIHCGKCGTCVERLEAFEKAGVKDGVKYGK